jgi:hypothetical protein
MNLLLITIVLIATGQKALFYISLYYISILYIALYYINYIYWLESWRLSNDHHSRKNTEMMARKVPGKGGLKDTRDQHYEYWLGLENINGTWCNMYTERV